MKKMLALLGALGATAAIVFAAPATSVPNSNIARRVTALEGKVKAMKATERTLKANAATLASNVSTLQSSVSTLKGCFAAQGLSQAGSPSSQVGYVWTQGGSLYVTTALDFPASGQTPLLYVASIKGDCVGSSASQFSTRTALAHARSLAR